MEGKSGEEICLFVRDEQTGSWRRGGDRGCGQRLKASSTITSSGPGLVPPASFPAPSAASAHAARRCALPPRAPSELEDPRNPYVAVSSASIAVS